MLGLWATSFAQLGLISARVCGAFESGMISLSTFSRTLYPFMYSNVDKLIGPNNVVKKHSGRFTLPSQSPYLSSLIFIYP